FDTNANRVKHRQETVALVRSVMVQRSCNEWIAELDEAGIPCSPLNTLGDLSAHPHTAAVEMIRTYKHPVLGEIKTVSQPVRFEGDRTPIRRPAPMLGQHT